LRRLHWRSQKMASPPSGSPECAQETANDCLVLPPSEMVCECGRCLIMNSPDEPVVPMRQAIPEEVQNISPTCTLQPPRVIYLPTQRNFALGPVENSRSMISRRSIQSRGREDERTSSRRRIEAMRDSLPFLLDTFLVSRGERGLQGEREIADCNPNPEIGPLAAHASMLSPPPFPREEQDLTEGRDEGIFARGFAAEIEQPQETTCGSASDFSGTNQWSPFSWADGD